jgi:hypothetical protein
MYGMRANTKISPPKYAVIASARLTISAPTCTNHSGSFAAKM